MKLSKSLLFLVSILGFGNAVFCTPPRVELSYFADTRQYNTLTLTTSAHSLPFDMSVWGFVDLHSQQNTAASRFDITRYFLDYRLTVPVPNIQGLGLVAKVTDMPGDYNALLRGGISYNQSFSAIGSGWLQFQGFGYQSNAAGYLMSVACSQKLDLPLVITGFADYNISNTQSPVWVTETQFNYPLSSHYWAQVEVRYNGYEAKTPGMDGFGVALGLMLSL